jgi:tryptophanyl-tRNA synthetase
MSAVTDSTNSVSYDPKNRPGVSNLLHLLSHFDSQERSAQELGTVYSKLTLKDLKITISDTRERYKQILSEDAGAYVDHIEKKGAKKARENAEATMVAVREAVGYDS